jgi:uroporphyrin-III C-methyltransferase/precorrin-2 dehydrogenase/sirohydrochlorin ferrochelatase
MMQGFPLFLSLHGRRALVVGGTDQAARKVELLLAAGAQLSLIAESVTGEIAQLIDDGCICWAGRAFEASELEGVSIVVVASDDALLRVSVSQAAQARGVPVNVVDQPGLSSFIMPAIVDRGPVTIAISTGGTAPALARKLRAEIERALPAAIGRLARFAEIFRTQVRRTIAEPSGRRLFWDRVFNGRIGELALAGDEIAARRELIRLLDSSRNDPWPSAGMVHVVAAGPGDPDLLTLKAHRLLQHAEVIVYDRMVSAAVLAMARRDAERVCVPASEAARRLIALVRSGKSVVRLTGADSIGEVEALLAADISVEVVPGVTGTNDRKYRFESGFRL